MELVHFERMPVPGRHSIEGLFRQIRQALSDRFVVDVVRCPTPHDSKWWLPIGIFRARARSRDINHIVGDIHYVALGLPKNRTVLTIHDLNRLDHLHGMRKTLYRWLYFTLPLRHCRAVTAVSHCTRERLVELFPFISEKCTVIPDCVGADFVQSPKAFN